MRKQFCTQLAVYAGQTLTQDVAVALVRALFPDNTLKNRIFRTQQYKNYTFQCEIFREIIQELHPLESQRLAQTGMGADGYELDIDIDDLIEREYAGGLLQCTSRLADGTLVGHMRAYITRSKDTDSMIGTDSAFYVTPAHRGGFMAVRLWQFTEQCGVDIGVREIYCSSKLENGADRMAKYLGYEPEYLLHSKRIKNQAQECSNKGVKHG